MKVRYVGESCASLEFNNVYEVLGIEDTWYRIVDEMHEDYIFPPELFEVVEDDKNP